MRTLRRSFFGAATLALLGIQMGCDDVIPSEGGYEIVSARRRDDIVAPAAPPPPPVVAGLSSGAAAVPQLAAATAPPGVTQEMVEAGAQQFSTVCAACHGSGGGGSPAGPALNDAEWLNINGSYDEIVTIINNGVADPRQYPAPMPPRGGGNFNEEQVRAIGAYVFALSHQ